MDMCMRTGMGMCTDMCVGMCAGMRAGLCIGVCMHMCMHIRMYDGCVGTDVLYIDSISASPTASLYELYLGIADGMPIARVRRAGSERR